MQGNSNGSRSGKEGIVRSWNAETSGFVDPQAGQSVTDRWEQVLNLFQRRKWLIILTFLLVVAGAAIYTYSQVPTYQASSLVFVEDQTEEKALRSGPSTQAEDLGGRSSGSLQNELAVLQSSQSLREHVAQRLVDTGKGEEFLKSENQSPLGRLTTRVWTSVRQQFGVEGTEAEASENQTAPSVAAVAKALTDSVQFSRVKQTNRTIRITASDEDPELATLVANLYAAEYVNLTKESSRAQVAASRKFLQKQAEKRKQDLRAIERKIQTYQQQEKTVNLEREEGVLVNRISSAEADLEETRVKLQMERSSLKSLQAQLDSYRPDELSQRVGSSLQEEIDGLQSKIADLKLSKQELLLESGPPTSVDSAQIEQIERRVRKLRTEISERSEEYVDEIMKGGLSAEAGAQRIQDLKRNISKKRVAITGLEARIKVLNDRLQTFEAELNSLPEKSMQLAQLRREQGYAEQMYEFINKQLQEARLQEQSELGYASEVSEASPPSLPTQPRPGRNLLLGVLVGLVGGIGLALGRDLVDNRLYRPDRLGELGYHELGVVPNLTPLIEDRLEGQRKIERSGEELDTSLVGVAEPHSAAAESYRQIRTRLQHSRPDEPKDTLLVTSPGAGDGKSVTAANLAIATAETGRSTLLVDTDLHRPQVHKLFGMAQSPGLVDTLKADLQKHVKTPPVENLFVLPAGVKENSSELLNSGRFHQFMDMATEHFDSVILDTSPVLANTDASLLATQADATLCVVRAGTTTEPEVDRAMGILTDVGAEITGVVFNGFDVSMAYGYRHRYRSYGQYGAYDQYLDAPNATE